MPFVIDKNQKLNPAGLRRNIELYEERGFDGYVAFGCMGEFYAATEEEFRKTVDIARDATKKIACVFGTTFHNTDDCLRRTRYAEDAGADGVMIGPPYLVPCTAESAFEHYRSISDSTRDIPIMVYNNPGSFKFNIDPELWDKLMTVERIVAVKESNGEVVHRSRVLSHISDRINVFSGGENWLLGDSLLGAKGMVAVVGPGTPKASSAFFRACMNGDIKTAISYHVKFSELFKDITAENEVAWLKACAEFGGLSAGPPRRPYPPLNASLKHHLHQKLSSIEKIPEAG